MRVSYILSFAVALVAPGLCQAGVFSENPAKSDSPTIRETFLHERRYLLYNSRSLSGECLDVCVDDRGDPPVGGTTRPPTKSPTASPTVSPTVSPTKSPTESPTESPTKNPTASPTVSPTVSPTKNPTASPTVSPTVSPTKSPTKSPTESPTGAPVAPTPRLHCECEADDHELQQSWKCGNDVYVCPGVDQICSDQDSRKSKYYAITDEECDLMRAKTIGDNSPNPRCLALPRYGLTDPKALSNRVCYTYIEGVLTGYKEDGSCKKCRYTKPIRYEPLI